MDKQPIAPAESSELIQHPYQAPEGFSAPQPGVFKASTVFFPNVAAMRQRQWKERDAYTYGLHGTPTTFTLEQRLCTLEGGSHALLVPSGLAALSLVNLSLLGQGDEVLLPDNVYGPNKALAKGELARMGVSCKFYDPMQPHSLAALLSDRTRLVWLEVAGSVTMEFPDVPELVRLCKAKGVTCALDNTWGAGLAFAPFDLLGDGKLGVDISVHALTKYPSGGGDVLMGSVISRDETLHLRLKMTHMRLGFGVGVNDVESILRSLPSMALRYARQDETARMLARWVHQQPHVVQMLHPALPGSPGHEHWQALCARDGGAGRAAGLFSFVISAQCSRAQVDAFCDALQRFHLGYSWGGPISLVMPYELDDMRELPCHHLAQGHVVRLSTGLEDSQWLQEDLAQAWVHLA